MLDEAGSRDIQSDIYKLVKELNDEKIGDNITLSRKQNPFSLKSLSKELYTLKTSILQLAMSSYFKLFTFLWELTLFPFWANLYPDNYEFKFITNLIRTNKLRGRQFHRIFRFIDDLCTFNDGGEFCKAFLEIYPTEL